MFNKVLKDSFYLINFFNGSSFFAQLIVFADFIFHEKYFRDISHRFRIFFVLLIFAKNAQFREKVC